MIETDRKGILLTVKVPGQFRIKTDSQVQYERLPPTELQLFAPARGVEEVQAITNAFTLLEVLYRHNVTDPHVLKVLLTAVGHHERHERPYQFSAYSSGEQTDMETALGVIQIGRMEKASPNE